LLDFIINLHYRKGIRAGYNPALNKNSVGRITDAYSENTKSR